MSAPYQALTIAQWFINRAYMDVDDGGEMMTHWKLENYLFFAQGCFCAMTGNALFDEEIYACRRGAAISSVYNKYNEYGANSIEDTAPVEIDKDTEEILKEVYRIFSQFSALGLSMMVREGSPWRETEIGSEFPRDAITEFCRKNYID